MAISTLYTTAQVTAIIDNISKSLIDIESAQITTSASTLTNVVAGQTGATSSLLARLATSTSSQDSLVQFWGAKAASAMAAAAGLTSAGFYPFYEQLILALEKDLSGISEYLRANSILVHPEFANLVNFYSTVQPGDQNPPAPIIPTSIMVSAETKLAQITETGASAGTFAATTATNVVAGVLNQLVYGPAQKLQIKNITGGTSTGTATAFTITYTDATGNASASKVFTLSGAQANNTLTDLGITGYAVSNITVTSGAASDIFAIMAEPTRTVAY